MLSSLCKCISGRCDGAMQQTKEMYNAVQALWGYGVARGQVIAIRRRANSVKAREGEMLQNEAKSWWARQVAGARKRGLDVMLGKFERDDSLVLARQDATFGAALRAQAPHYNFRPGSPLWHNHSSEPLFSIALPSAPRLCRPKYSSCRAPISRSNFLPNIRSGLALCAQSCWTLTRV
jgi:hypothetical protein